MLLLFSYYRFLTFAFSFFLLSFCYLTFCALSILPLSNCYLSAQFAGLDLQEKPRETYRPPHLRNKPAGESSLGLGTIFIRST